MKKIILLLFAFVFVTNIYAVNYDNTVKVHDYAQVFSENEQKIIKEKINQYIEKYNMDMVVIAVKYYSTDTIDNYAKEIYEKYNYGKGDNNSCVMFILDLKDNYYYVNTFNDSNNLLSSNEISDIRNKIKKTQGNYDKVLSFINYTSESAETVTEKASSSFNLGDINWILILLLSSLMPALIFIVFMLKLNKEDLEEVYYDHLRENSLTINDRVDKFINTYTKQKS